MEQTEQITVAKYFQQQERMGALMCARAIRRGTNTGSFVVDLYDGSLTYISPDLRQYAGVSEAGCDWKTFLKERLTASEMAMTMRARVSAQSMISGLFADELENCKLTCVLRLQKDPHAALFNVSLFPYVLNSGMAVRFIVGSVTLSGRRNVGGFLLSVEKKHVFTYCSEQNVWEKNLLPQLSREEIAVLVATARGIPEKDVSEKIKVSASKLKRMKRSLVEKLHVENIHEAMLFAWNHNLMMPDGHVEYLEWDLY